MQECSSDQAKGIGGTGQGFDAPSAGRAGGKGFGAHNVLATGLRTAMIRVRASCCSHAPHPGWPRGTAAGRPAPSQASAQSLCQNRCKRLSRDLRAGGRAARAGAGPDDARRPHAGRQQAPAQPAAQPGEQALCNPHAALRLRAICWCCFCVSCAPPADPSAGVYRGTLAACFSAGSTLHQPDLSHPLCACRRRQRPQPGALPRCRRPSPHLPGGAALRAGCSSRSSTWQTRTRTSSRRGLGMGRRERRRAAVTWTALRRASSRSRQSLPGSSRLPSAPSRFMSREQRLRRPQPARSSSHSSGTQSVRQHQHRASRSRVQHPCRPAHSTGASRRLLRWPGSHPSTRRPPLRVTALSQRSLQGGRQPHSLLCRRDRLFQAQAQAGQAPVWLR